MWLTNLCNMTGSRRCAYESGTYRKGVRAGRLDQRIETNGPCTNNGLSYKAMQCGLDGLQHGGSADGGGGGARYLPHGSGWLVGSALAPAEQWEISLSQQFSG